MIAGILLREAGRDRRGLALRAGLPLLVVAGAAPAGYASPALAILIIFTGMIGGGMAIIKLRSAGMYDRLIACPCPKPRLFLEISGAGTLLHLLEYSPAILLATLLAGPAILAPAVLSVAIVGVMGTLVGMASRSFGDMHLNALLAVIPLLLAGVVASPLSLLFPFRPIMVPEGDPLLVIPSLFTLAAVYGILVLHASRL